MGGSMLAFMCFSLELRCNSINRRFEVQGIAARFQISIYTLHKCFCIDIDPLHDETGFRIGKHRPQSVKIGMV